MSVQWFRFYNDAMRHPKVASLSDAEFRLWVELLCVASENDGHIPPEETLKKLLRRRLDHLQRGLRALLKVGLMDALDVGYEPHGWSKRQYKSDSSTERSRRHRKKRNVAATVNATPPDTEADTEAELSPKGDIARARSKKSKCPDNFWPKPKPDSQTAKRMSGWSRDFTLEQVEKFIAHHQDRGTLSPDWEKRWTTWALNNFDQRNDNARKQPSNRNAADLTRAKLAGLG